MANQGAYTTLNGREIPLADLDREELKLLRDLRQRARASGWDEFTNYWVAAVAALYDSRGVPRSESMRQPVYKIAQDLEGRLAIAEGKARTPDYRDELARLIRERFPTRRAFCEATGLSEDMLSHVLARRKHLAIDTLARSLDRIGVDIRLVARQVEHASPTSTT
jgi:hypothetical protein